ncbi:MAG TPA: S8 family serine peptidase [Flavobacterium sp.]|nr:S8 family serine peptidase [Flavobacterium sp.]
MKAKLFKISVIAILAFSSCSKDDTAKEASIAIDPAQKEPLSAAQVKSQIKESLQANGSFSWGQASSHLLWSASVCGQNIITIGFGKSADDFDRSRSANSAKMQNELLDFISKYEGAPLEKILVASDEDLNLVDVVILKQETIVALREYPNIRYIEPADYKYYGSNADGQRSSLGLAGCGFDAATLNAADYTLIAPNAKVPWNFYIHNIPDAWNYSTGAGITIGVIDSGISPNQSLLNSNFNDGFSSGRTVEKYGTFVDSFWPWSTATDGADDRCGHGTSMASVAASPRNDNGLPVGVAYNANLVSYRASSDVVVEGYHEQNGVKNAFTALGNRSDVKIISMSMGHIIPIGKIEDGVRYAYSRGKLIFCAGGTTTNFTTFLGVIFPAWMPEAVAVTGVKEGTSFQKCDICHTGRKIDFTVVMQRSGSNNNVPVNSYYDNQSDYVGGSSVATATTAGIAALVWSKHPDWTRDQVLAKMRQSGNFYPNKNPDFGYGNINVLMAVQ